MTNTVKTKSNADLAFELGRAMAELRIDLRRFIQIKIREHGINLTFEMLEVMSFLWRKDGINQQELADMTLRDKSSMTYLLDNLVKRNLVKRVEHDTDRRIRLIYLTAEGKALQEELHPWVAEVYDMAIRDVGAAQIQDGIYLLNKMIANLKKE